MDYQVMYSFVLYVLFIGLPMIPAILIYKKFPETKVGARGMLGGLKINATGAFAAYLVVSVLGFFIIRHIQGLITNSGYQTWEITAKLQFLDVNNHPHPDQENLVKLTHISVQPFIKNQNSDFVQFIASGRGRDIIVSFSSKEEFATRSFDLQKNEGMAVIDEPNRKINLGEVTFKEITTKYNVPETQGINDTVAGPPIKK